MIKTNYRLFKANTQHNLTKSNKMAVNAKYNVKNSIAWSINNSSLRAGTINSNMSANLINDNKLSVGYINHIKLSARFEPCTPDHQPAPIQKPSPASSRPSPAKSREQKQVANPLQIVASQLVMCNPNINKRTSADVQPFSN